jgi:hypothetical protein
VSIDSTFYCKPWSGHFGGEGSVAEMQWNIIAKRALPVLDPGQESILICGHTNEKSQRFRAGFVMPGAGKIRRLRQPGLH